MSESIEELQAQVRLLQEQEEQLATKEQELQHDAAVLAARVTEEPVYDPAAIPTVSYREHGRDGVDSGPRV